MAHTRLQTMRSITLKLTLAFLAVGLLGALLVAVFVGWNITRGFNDLVFTRDQTALIAALRQHYQTTGSWNGAASVIEQTWQAQDGPQGRRPPPVVLLDADGRVVVGNERYDVGTSVPSNRVPRQQIVLDDGTVAGSLLVGGPGGRGAWGPGGPEAAFLDDVAQAIVLSALGATAAALLLGWVLARTLTHPLRELTTATQAVAKGGLGQQVVVRSRDELGVLARSFNQMSADLARASALRRQMTADIAHDLRTPLSVILGYTEALRDGKLPPDQDMFDTMHTEAQHLQHLVDDLRTLSLADAGELPLVRQPFPPQALLERAAAAHRAHAQAQNTALVVDAAPDLPAVDVDGERMAQVLGNLLSNALRFTPNGGMVTLRAAGQGSVVQLQVQDTGSGIAPSDLPHIFDRFYRADTARQQQGSSGLGLAIAKSLVEAHGGTIGATSAPEHGTTFTITLPAHHAERQDARHADEAVTA